MTDKRIKSFLEDRLKRLESIRNEKEWTTAELGDIACCKQTLAFIDSMQEEPVSEDLGDYINKLSKQFPEVSFAKLSRIAVRVAKWQKKQDQETIEVAEDHAMLAGMEKMKEEKMANIWKPADGDRLPDIDKEVIALLDNGKVVFAHRPPEYWDGKNIITGKVTRYYPKTYGKGGWNIPNVILWLDLDIPKL